MSCHDLRARADLPKISLWLFKAQYTRTIVGTELTSRYAARLGSFVSKGHYKFRAPGYLCRLRRVAQVTYSDNDPGSFKIFSERSVA